MESLFYDLNILLLLVLLLRIDFPMKNLVWDIIQTSSLIVGPIIQINFSWKLCCCSRSCRTSCRFKCFHRVRSVTFAFLILIWILASIVSSWLSIVDSEFLNRIFESQKQPVKALVLEGKRIHKISLKLWTIWFRLLINWLIIDLSKNRNLQEINLIGNLRTTVESFNLRDSSEIL